MTTAVNVTVSPAPVIDLTVDGATGDPVNLTVAEPAVIQVDVGGEVGPPGPAGTSGGEVTIYPFTSLATWTVTHNLGRFPSVELIATDGSVFDADVEFPDLNTAVITHASPLSGSVLVS